MLGRVDPQGSLLDPGQLFGHLVTKGSFYEKLARRGHELISDDGSTPKSVLLVTLTIHNLPAPDAIPYG